MALFEVVHNYYERLVFSHIRETLLNSDKDYDERLLEDIACVALNQLPARYVREDVDTGFFLADDDLERMKLVVKDAVQTAIDKVASHPEGPQT